MLFFCLDVLVGFGDYKFSTSKNTCSLVCGLLHSASACRDDRQRIKENICKQDVSSDWWQPCARGLRKRLCVMCSASHDAIAKCQHSDCLAGAKIRQKKAFVKSILRKVNSFLVLTIEIRQKKCGYLKKNTFLGGAVAEYRKTVFLFSTVFSYLCRRNKSCQIRW